MNCAVSLVLFVKSFDKVNHLTLSQWYFSKLFHTVKLGGTWELESKNGMNEWMVVKITSNYETQELHLHPRHRKMRSLKTHSRDLSVQKQIANAMAFTLLPSTQILISFSTFSVTFCLDICRSAFNLTDLGLPFKLMLEYLLVAVQNISNFIKRPQSQMARVFITIIAHKPESDETFSVWIGEINSSSNVEDLKSLLRTRLDKVEDESIASQSSQKTSDLFCPTNVSTKSGFASLDSYIRAIHYHHSLSPRDACGKAVLITNGGMSVNMGTAHDLLCKSKLSLHVAMETISRRRSAVGFHQSDLELETLASSSNGSMERIGGRRAAEVLENLQTACERQFGESFFMESFSKMGPAFVSLLQSRCRDRDEGIASTPSTQNMATSYGIPNGSTGDYNSIETTKRWSQRSPNREGGSLNLDNFIQAFVAKEMGVGGIGVSAAAVESTLHSYEIERSTVNHLLSSRVSEGFQITDISQESRNGASASHPSDHWSQEGHRAGRSALGMSSRSQYPAQTYVTIKLERVISRLSMLVYEITFRLERGPGGGGSPSFSAGRTSSIQNLNRETGINVRNQSVRSIWRGSQESSHGGGSGALRGGGGDAGGRYGSHQFPEAAWTTGTISVDIRRVRFGGSDGVSSAALDRALTTAHALGKAIYELDKRIAALVSSPYMPAWKANAADPSLPRTGSMLPVPPVSPIERPDIRQLSAFADALERVASFDDIHVSNVFLCPNILRIDEFVSTGDVEGFCAASLPTLQGNGVVQSKLLKSVLSRLPNAETHQLGDMKWIITASASSAAMSTHSSTSSLISTSSSASRQPSASLLLDVRPGHPLVCIVEIIQRHSLLLKIVVKKITRQVQPSSSGF